MKIEVTAEDIRLGQKKNLRGDRTTTCPVARAVRRAIRDKSAWVGNIRFHLRIGDIEIPDKVKAFISRADTELPLKPFSFTLKIPESRS